jgi:hypothetical protein
MNSVPKLSWKVIALGSQAQLALGNGGGLTERPQPMNTTKPPFVDVLPLETIFATTAVAAIRGQLEQLDPSQRHQLYANLCWRLRFMAQRGSARENYLTVQQWARLIALHYEEATYAD